jgi:glycosyltransferase involved in cell wall biosynthesis
MRKIPTLLIVQDVWPDNATTRINEKGIFFKTLNKIQKFVYQRSRKIVVISDDIKMLLVSKGVNESKIKVIYNWSYSDEIFDIPFEENLFAKKVNLDPNYFYAVYAGNIGFVQNVEVILKAAKLLNHTSKIKFLIIGDGVNKDNCINYAKENGLINVIFYPMQTPEFAIHVYSVANINIIPLKQHVIKTALPSKTAICLSSGKPLIFSIEKDSHFSNLIQKNESGYITGVDDVEEFVKVIKLLYMGCETIKKANIYHFFLEHFQKRKNLLNYIDTIKNLNDNY